MDAGFIIGFIFLCIALCALSALIAGCNAESVKENELVKQAVARGYAKFTPGGKSWYWVSEEDEDDVE
jgi:hypothetical protein